MPVKEGTKRDPNKIYPRVTTRKHNTALKNASQREVLGGLMDDPRYEKLEPKHWHLIFTEWELADQLRRKPTLKQISEASGVRIETIRYWRCRRDYRFAQMEFNWVILHEYIPAMATEALKDAISGKDKRARMFFLELAFSDAKRHAQQIDAAIDTQININWGPGQDEDPELVIDSKALPDDPQIPATTPPPEENEPEEIEDDPQP